MSIKVKVLVIHNFLGVQGQPCPVPAAGEDLLPPVQRGQLLLEEHNLHCLVVVLYPLAVARIDQVTSWAVPLSLISQMWVLRMVSPLYLLWLKDFV